MRMPVLLRLRAWECGRAPAFKAPTSSLARSVRIRLMPAGGKDMKGEIHLGFGVQLCVRLLAMLQTCSSKRVRRAAETERGALGQLRPVRSY